MAECELRSPSFHPLDLQRGRVDGRGAAAAAPLDLHEGIDDPTGGCKRWPEHLRLLNEGTGELVRGRCRATNLCRYCQALYVVETVEMLTLDAMEYAPAVWVVLTAREHLTRAECRRHLAQLLRAARKRWPSIEWFVQVEFQRRGALHVNLLVKGVDGGEQEQLLAVLSERWCARVDALPVGQWAGTVYEAGGAVRYLSKMLAHGLKVEQRPPLGWRGHRTSQTRGYLVRPASVMREEARAALREKRRLWKAFAIAERCGGGADAAFVEFVFEQLEARELEHASWRLVGQTVGRDVDVVRREQARAPFVELGGRGLSHRSVPDSCRIRDIGPELAGAPGDGRRLAGAVRVEQPDDGTHVVVHREAEQDDEHEQGKPGFPCESASGHRWQVAVLRGEADVPGEPCGRPHGETRGLVMTVGASPGLEAEETKSERSKERG